MKRNLILLCVVLLIGGAIFYLESTKPRHAGSVIGNSVATSTVHTPDYATRTATYPMAQELVMPDGYINTGGQPLTISSLVGKKVVLIDFWTYSCINCQRTIPYLNAWYQKYKDYGLEIVGVHAPEFEFEKVLSNVQMGVTNFGIKYPVVLDSELRTWDAYKNMYWPEHYLMDINGLVVDRHIGEGGYAETEQKIQQLLKERATALGLTITIPTGTVDINQTIETQSPETYFGWSRNEYLTNGPTHTPGPQTFAPLSTQPALNSLYLVGSWNFENEYAESASAETHIFYTYNATKVYFVAGAAKGVSITVKRDGVVVGAQKGEDVDASGNVMIKEARLYKLIQESTQGQHTIEVIVHNPGLQAFTFTFG